MQPYYLLPAQGTDQTSEWIALGYEAHKTGDLKNAQKHYARALRLSPCHPIASTNLAIALVCAGNLLEGLLAVERAALYGDDPLVMANMAMMYLDCDRMEAAIAAANLAMSLAQVRPVEKADELTTANYIGPRFALAIISASSGHPELALPAYREMLAVDPKHVQAGVNSCFIQSLMDIGPDELRIQRSAWRETNGWKGKYWPHRNKKDPAKVLRVGYVGGDFKSHSAAMMFAHVLLNHDRANVIPYAYSTLPVDRERDDLTAAFQDRCEWRDVDGKTDEFIEELIQADEIDILVDLAGHTNGGRLALFTRRPAPVQVTAWGFAHGTGLPEIDYFLADPVAVPENERPYFAEKIWDVPSIVTYRPPTEYGIKEASSAPFQQNQYITFGSFSRYEKLSDECLRCFAEILVAVPGSKLYLKDHAFRRPYSIRRVLNALAGIDRDRVIFGVATSHPEHMIEYQKADIILDTFPHGMGVVSMEALYCGVPIITLYGKQPSGRSASSVLTAMGRTEWITRTPEEYVERAVEWAGRTKDLADARKTLRQEFVSSPVVAGYPAAIENAYRGMWKEWCCQR